MDLEHFEECPRTTNAVERHNRQCKEQNPVGLEYEVNQCTGAPGEPSCKAILY